MSTRGPDPFSEGTLEALRRIRKRLSREELMVFLGLCRMKPERFEAILDGTGVATTPTLLGLAVVAEYICIPTPLQKLPDSVDSFVKVFFVSQKDLASFFRDETTKNNFLRYVRGKGSLTETVLRNIEFAVAHNKKYSPDVVALNQACIPLSQAIVRNSGDGGKKILQPGEEKRRRVRAIRNIGNVSSETRAERFGSIVANLTGFSMFYVSDKVSNEERDELRRVVGQQRIFDLKNLLARLCSETAFKKLQ